MLVRYFKEGVQRDALTDPGVSVRFDDLDARFELRLHNYGGSTVQINMTREEANALIFEIKKAVDSQPK